MNIQIEKDFTFLTAIHFEKKYMVNLYELCAKMEVLTENPKEQNIAIERMNYFLTGYIENVIFIQDTEKEAIQNYTNAGIKVCPVPEEPYDQIIGMILINKCNAIMENRIAVTEITFGSKLSNLIKFNISGEIAKLEYPENVWYNKNTLSVTDKHKKDKIVSLFDINNWAELELTWK
jgi:hypothetical protein